MYSSHVSCISPHAHTTTGKDIDAETPIGSGDLAIHTMHLMSNNLWIDESTEEINDNLDENPLANIVDWFEQYIWVPHSSGGQFELEHPEARIVTAVPGIGVLGSYNPKLTNADWNHSSSYHRESWNEYPGLSHPGRGAYSNYYHLEMASTEVIPAGKEIFLEFGQNWEEESEKQKETLTRKDYEKVDQTIEKIIAFFDKYNDDLDQASKLELYQFLMKDVMEAAAGASKGQQIARMLPDDPSKLKDVMEAGGAFYLSSPNAVRKIDWLEENGLCMDNIRPGPSTVPYAGRGAFARRKIPKGGLVAPVPLIQIPDEEVLDMHKVKPVTFEGTDEEEQEETVFVREEGENSKTTGKQLLLNYCWGHPESSVLLFPTGMAVNYINHNSDKSKVNAKMIWSDHPSNRKEWLKIPPEELVEKGNDYMGLLMELVATQDIEEGDEIFLDYGYVPKRSSVAKLELILTSTFLSYFFFFCNPLL
jgi:SET domain